MRSLFSITEKSSGFAADDRHKTPYAVAEIAMVSITYLLVVCQAS
jgi:hypothetical protein